MSPRAKARAIKTAERILLSQGWDGMDRFYVLVDIKGTPEAISFRWTDFRALAAYVLSHQESEQEQQIQRAGKLPKGHRVIRRGKWQARNAKARQRRQG